MVISAIAIAIGVTSITDIHDGAIIVAGVVMFVRHGVR